MHIAQTILVMIKNLVIKLIDIIIKISEPTENVFYVKNIICMSYEGLWQLTNYTYIIQNMHSI